MHSSKCGIGAEENPGLKVWLGRRSREIRCSSLTKIIIILGSYMSGSAREEMNSVNLIFRVTELDVNLYKVWY